MDMKYDDILYGFPERTTRPEIDPSWLKERLLSGTSVAQIARETGYSRQAIYDNVKKYRLKVPRCTDIDPEWLRQEKKKGRTDKDIPEELGVTVQAIFKIHSNHNIRGKHVAIDNEWLAEQKVKGRSDREILRRR
jgi:transposase-like protein